MDQEEDDWNPDPKDQDSILQKVVVHYTNKDIKQAKKRTENKEYDPSYVQQFLRENFDDEIDGEDEDDDQIMTKEEKQLRRQIIDQEQLFFDPLDDDLNEAWVKSKHKGFKDNQIVLNCPNCFIQLCYDSQRHETYKHQYRAVLVCNCRVISDKVVKPLGEVLKKGKAVANPMDIYFAVECQNCNVNVAVYEVSKKVYHFFNVIPGLG